MSLGNLSPKYSFKVWEINPGKDQGKAEVTLLLQAKYRDNLQLGHIDLFGHFYHGTFYT